MDPYWILVASTGFKNGWIDGEWLIILAISLSLNPWSLDPLNP